MPGMGMNLYEQAPRTLQGDTWWGMGWTWEDSDAQLVRDAAVELLSQVDEIRRLIQQIPNQTTRPDYENRVNSIESMAKAKVQTANTTGYKNETAFKDVMKQLTVSAPTELNAMRPLIVADQQDPSGKTSGKLVESRLAQIQAEQKARAESFVVDPVGSITRTAESVGGSVRDVQSALFKEWLKTMWPWLLVGGGALATVYFWPVISRWLIAKRAAMARKPGDLMAGTQHQPGE